MIKGSLLRELVRKPEYLFRPAQIARRLRRACQRSVPEFAEEVLPWGLRLRFQPLETIGASIWRMGIYDLCVSEAISRLLDPGEIALDVGANIGHMTSIMALRVGGTGSVLAFEPHPEVYPDLVDNIALWKDKPGIGRVAAHRVALSDACGKAILHVPEDFDSNRGTASLIPRDRNSNGDPRSHHVETVRLDSVLAGDFPIGLMKLDVEGHEVEVLRGAVECLTRHRIRDIVFEEHGTYPTPATELLERHGYTIVRLTKGLLGLTVSPITQAVSEARFETRNCLATLDSMRAQARFARRGWRVLRNSKPPKEGHLHRSGVTESRFPGRHD